MWGGGGQYYTMPTPLRISLCFLPDSHYFSSIQTIIINWWWGPVLLSPFQASQSETREEGTDDGKETDTTNNIYLCYFSQKKKSKTSVSNHPSYIIRPLSSIVENFSLPLFFSPSSLQNNNRRKKKKKTPPLNKKKKKSI